jgi:Raf kinase inhibitor-like YbhB/YbcL family protein
MHKAMMVIGMAAALGLALGTGASAAGKKKMMKAPKLTVTSDQIKNGGKIADEQAANVFGCNGGNISPELTWSGAPAGTKSFAVTIYDPDAPTGSGFWHWVIFNIPPTVTELPKNAGYPQASLAPPGSIQSRTDFGFPAYGGPCPPPGDKPHHYHITVFAVDADHLDGDPNTSAAVIGFQLHYHTLAKGELIGLYGRAK